MTLSEKSAYLKGLMEGMELKTDSNEGKMIAAIVELLGDVTKTLSDVQETTIAISDELDEIEDDLDAIEDFIKTKMMITTLTTRMMTSTTKMTRMRIWKRASTLVTKRPPFTRFAAPAAM